MPLKKEILLIRMRSRGVFCAVSGAMDERFRRGAVEDSAAEGGTG